MEDETKFVLGLLGRAALWMVIGLLLLYAGDWAVWRSRVARGGGMGQVEVSRMTVASLKGNKEEYYDDGTSEVACSRSLFPQMSGGACWWLERHKVVMTRF